MNKKDYIYALEVSAAATYYALSLREATAMFLGQLGEAFETQMIKGIPSKCPARAKYEHFSAKSSFNLISRTS